jgi:hypothetical protein
VSFRWRLLLKTGLSLVQQVNASEAQIRSAMNRAYYAAFGEAREFAERHGYRYIRGKGGSHDQVWNFLRQGHGAKTPWERAAWKAIGDAGIVLKRERITADYFGDPTVTRNETKRMLATAEVIINRLLNLP